MLYYKFDTGFYSKYASVGDELQFVYKIIPYSAVYNANIEVETQQKCYTVTSSNDVLVRSAIGGLVAGEVGAVIGGLTSPTSSSTGIASMPKKIIFSVLTVDDVFPVISMEFRKSWGGSGDVASNKTMMDACAGTFSPNQNHAHFYERKATRNGCGTTSDYIYERCAYDTETATSRWYSDGNLETILAKLKNYAMKIDSIVHKNNLEKQSTEQSRTTDVVAELIKLSELKNQGIITEEEFTKLKAKYL